MGSNHRLGGRVDLPHGLRCPGLPTRRDGGPEAGFFLSCRPVEPPLPFSRPTVKVEPFGQDRVAKLVFRNAK